MASASTASGPRTGPSNAAETARSYPGPTVTSYSSRIGRAPRGGTGLEPLVARVQPTASTLTRAVTARTFARTRVMTTAIKEAHGGFAMTNAISSARALRARALEVLE